MIILGVNAFHADSAAALLRDGRLVAAAEEERFRRVKHWAGFPSRAIDYCLREAGISIGDVDHVAVNQDSRASLFRKIGYVLSRPPNLRVIGSRLRTRSSRRSLKSVFAHTYPGQSVKAQFHDVEHHFAHLASAFYVSPFEDAAVVSVDGFGDFSSYAWASGAGTDLIIQDRVHFPHSLGIFYQALTQFLGFQNYGDEYKVMGLAPYGAPTHSGALSQLVRLKPGGKFELDLQFFRHEQSAAPMEWADGSPSFEELFTPALEQLLGPRRNPSSEVTQFHMDIAKSVQDTYEGAFLHLLQHAHERTGSTNVALAGGCAMNSVANGKIRRATPFKKVYVQAAAGDAGGGLGAALAVWYKLGGKRNFTMDHAYWGPGFRLDEVQAALAERELDLRNASCRLDLKDSTAALCSVTAQAIAAGHVVGWFQGRMEWGPRALGNRSILCDPRRPDMKALLNAKIKRRESFRPFAPSVLEDAVAEWFEEEDSVPFMMQVFQIRAEKRSLIPAVTHVDGSGRLQTVHRSTNPVYHQLIEEFRRITAVPMVLNTSFNENEPVVCTPQEALDCFLRTNMDMLVLGNVVVSRQ